MIDRHLPVYGDPLLVVILRRQERGILDPVDWEHSLPWLLSSSPNSLHPLDVLPSCPRRNSHALQSRSPTHSPRLFIPGGQSFDE